MPEFVQDVPLWDLATWCVALTVGATWIGILLIKPFLRLLVGGEPNVNDTIGHATSVFGLFYGLLVGLLSVAAYQNAEDVEHAAFSEAASLATVYGDLAAYPEPFRSEAQAMVRDYALYAIHKEWPAHREGRILVGGAHRADALRLRLARFEPASVSQEIVHREVVRAFHEFTVARQQRLAGVLTRLPDVLWAAVAAGAAVNIVLIVMLKVRPVPHLVLGGLTSFFLGVMLFVIIALDDPMRGETGIRPEAMRVLYESRMVFDEPVY